MPGRWNHNPSRVQDLVRDLNDAGFGVQLKHIEEETTWEEHGDVVLKDADGNELARSERFQHNRNFGNRGEAAAAILATVSQKAKL